MFDLLWDYTQQREIDHAHTRADRAGTQAQHAQREARNLQTQVDSLTLACAAMWSLLSERWSLTNEDLGAKMREIDLLDGKADGKVTSQARTCPKCHRQCHARHKACLYCGESLATGAPFGG